MASVSSVGEFNLGEKVFELLYQLIVIDGRMDKKLVLDKPDQAFETRANAFLDITVCINEDLDLWKVQGQSGLPSKLKTLLFLSEKERGGEMVVNYIQKIYNASQATKEENFKKLQVKLENMEIIPSKDNSKGMKEAVVQRLGDGVRWALRALFKFPSLRTQKRNKLWMK